MTECNLLQKGRKAKKKFTDKQLFLGILSTTQSFQQMN